MSTPTTHLEEAHKLTADALVSLFEILLIGTATPVILCFTDGPTVTWQGKLYEGHAIKMGSINRNADGERPRPSLQIVNPIGLFNGPAHAGYFEGAQVTRHRVLRAHVISNTLLSDTTYWYIAKIKELIANQSISFDLRMLSDGPEQQIPARMYTPPTFPFVTF